MPPLMLEDANTPKAGPSKVKGVALVKNLRADATNSGAMDYPHDVTIQPVPWLVEILASQVLRRTSTLKAVKFIPHPRRPSLFAGEGRVSPVLG